MPVTIKWRFSFVHTNPIPQELCVHKASASKFIWHKINECWKRMLNKIRRYNYEYIIVISKLIKLGEELFYFVEREILLLIALLIEIL